MAATWRDPVKPGETPNRPDLLIPGPKASSGFSGSRRIETPGGGEIGAAGAVRPGLEDRSKLHHPPVPGGVGAALCGRPLRAPPGSHLPPRSVLPPLPIPQRLCGVPRAVPGRRRGENHTGPVLDDDRQGILDGQRQRITSCANPPVARSGAPRFRLSPLVGFTSTRPGMRQVRRNIADRRRQVRDAALKGRELIPPDQGWIAVPQSLEGPWKGFRSQGVGSLTGEDEAALGAGSSRLPVCPDRRSGSARAGVCL